MGETMYKTVNLLVVDDDESLVKVFERVAKEQGLSVMLCRNGVEALEFLNKNVVEVAVVEVAVSQPTVGDEEADRAPVLFP